MALSAGVIAGVVVAIVVLAVVFGFLCYWHAKRDRAMMIALLQANRDRQAARQEAMERGEVPQAHEGVEGWTQAGETKIITGEIGRVVDDKKAEPTTDKLGDPIPQPKRKWWQPYTLAPVARPANYDPRTGEAIAAPYSGNFGGGM